MKLKDILYVIGAIITVTTVLVGAVTAYAKLTQTVQIQSEAVKEHAQRIDTVEKAVVEQKTLMQGVKEGQNKQQEKLEKIYELLLKERTNG